jgi:hypothetical protein
MSYHPTKLDGYYTITELVNDCKINGLNIPHITIANWCRKGLLPSQKYGKLFYIKGDDFCSFVNKGTISRPKNWNRFSVKLREYEYEYMKRQNSIKGKTHSSLFHEMFKDYMNRNPIEGKS